MLKMAFPNQDDFLSTSVDETVAYGRKLSCYFNIRRGVTVIGLSSEITGVGKSTLLYGLISCFTPVSEGDFKKTQVGGRPRIYSVTSEDYFILSYDAKTWKGDPRSLITGDRENGLICIEHAGLIDLSSYQLQANAFLHLVKTKSDFHSPRQITLKGNHI
jgi:hypothetical protein